MKYIELTQGYQAIVDDEDYELLGSLKWHYSHGYAVRKDKTGTTWLHREIAKSKSEVDHKNRNKLDNRKANLRPATRSQNNANHSRQRNNTSGAKGVHQLKSTGLFQAYIKINGKRTHLGTYDTRRMASNAYNAQAKLLFGEFAKLNRKET